MIYDLCAVIELWNALCRCRDVKMWLLQVRIGTRTDNLAQESLSRLSETGRDSPRPFARAIAQVGHLRFERENALLKRGDLASAS